MPYQTVEVASAGSLGLVADLRPHELPAEAWTQLINIRTDKNELVAFPGHVSALVPEVRPYHVLSITSATLGQQYWVYLGLAGARAYDGSPGPHVDLTPTPAFTGSEDDIWTSTQLNLNLVVNNVIDQPHYWDVNPANPFVLLPGWDANWRAESIRAFKTFLIALGTTESGTAFPYRLRWSNAATPGGLPADWDDANPTSFAGFQDLGDRSSALVDGAPLRNSFMVYTEHETYALDFVGGEFVWSIRTLSRQSGALSKRAVRQVRTQQLVITDNDVVLVDGQSVRTAVNRRVREWMFRTLCQQKLRRTYTAENIEANEIWVCFPSAGSEWPNVALVWDYISDTWGVRDLPENTAHLGLAHDFTRAALTWDTNGFTWDTWQQRWNERNYSTAADVILSATEGHIHRFDSGNQFNGVNRVALAERIGLRLGDDQVKTITELWPRMTGDPVDIYVGAQMEVGSVVRWEGPFAFDPATQRRITCRVTGRYPAIRVQSEGDAAWRLQGYTAHYAPQGWK